ncbi:hypothetical protein PIB30_082528, partial [Stylosanthes scabra]|nr:hypothetical protein [Stylosanthes scabra]
GYFTKEDGEIIVWMGEEIEGNTEGEAQLKELEMIVQFLLEELNVRNGSARLISGCKNIVDWAGGEQGTSWDNRFLRNKTHNMKEIFEDVKLVYKPVNEYKAKSQWEEMAMERKGRWIIWDDS